ncbi:MAG: DUF896 domain-containing protein [Anaerovibrio sp.]|nr:DUF896 domain-containing protein [Selenomonadaceae bacterium]MDD6398451.1 DUF896 domain-containing protein [Selenomonadaceae bacterium]MDY6053401.1 DUF896 domain-containing protein [Anaerovibrio sp.]
MITDEMIQEINYLSRKQRSEGLNDEEKQRQQFLRRAYIDAMKTNLKSILDNVEIVDKDKMPPEEQHLVH